MSKAMARPRHVDIPGETILLELPESLAGAIRDALGGRPFRVLRHWFGNTADAYLLALEPGTPRLVLKVARTGHSLRDDIEALRRAATLAPAGVVPAIVGAFASDAACLVEYIPGLSPAVYLRRRSARAGLAADIVAALQAYHTALGCAFGDFHPENVTVRRNGVSLLDPGFPDQHGRAEREPPMVTDLGLWVHAIASNVVTYVVRGPCGALRMLSLAVDVAACGCREAGADPAQVLEVADRHMNDLRESQWPRDRVTALVAARPALWWLKRRIRRAAARAIP